MHCSHLCAALSGCRALRRLTGLHRPLASVVSILSLALTPFSTQALQGHKPVQKSPPRAVQARTILLSVAPTPNTEHRGHVSQGRNSLHTAQQPCKEFYPGPHAEKLLSFGLSRKAQRSWLLNATWHLEQPLVSFPLNSGACSYKAS